MQTMRKLWTVLLRTVVKLRLADAWKIKLSTDAEKVREVARLIDEENKSYSAAVKNASNDSDIDVLTREIKNQVEICVEEKLHNLGSKQAREPRRVRLREPTTSKYTRT